MKIGKVTITWKEMVGIAGLIVSGISAAMSAHLFPPAYNVALASVSTFLLAFEGFVKNNAPSASP
jgi:cytochrome b subunit of formate dehydrogenase